MTFDQLHYFIAIAESQNMSRAAETLNVAQPALSRTMARMEEELGTTLFDRHGKSIVLNSNGQEFLRFARKCVSDLQNTRSNLQSENLKGTLHLGNLIENMAVIRAIANFASLYPGISLQVDRVTKIEDPDSYGFFFSSGEYDVVHMNQTFSSQLLWTEPMGVIVSRKHPFANRTEVSLKELEDCHFVLSNSFEYSSFIGNFFRLANFTPKSLFRTNDPSMMVETVRQTNHVALSPIYAYLYDNHDDFRILKLINPEYARKVYMYWNSSRKLSNTEQVFLNYIREYPWYSPKSE